MEIVQQVGEDVGKLCLEFTGYYIGMWAKQDIYRGRIYYIVYKIYILNTK